jgi:hypothetical protein
MICRANGCGCEATHGLYCGHCDQFRPLCPVCSAVYGEHRLTCTVADGYTDCQEGPWETREAAEAFARAEVGKPWQVERGEVGGWYVMVKDED